MIEVMLPGGSLGWGPILGDRAQRGRADGRGPAVPAGQVDRPARRPMRVLGLIAGTRAPGAAGEGIRS
jgi:hypothetical protein